MTAAATSMDDTALLALARNGDVVAFETLYKRHWRTLLDEAHRRLKGLEEAEEVVQEVFVSLYARIRELPPTENLAGYLFRAVQYTVYKKIRAHLVARRYQDEHSRFNAEPVSDDAELEAYKTLELALAEAIGRLPDRCREVYRLSREQGYTYTQIARALGISESTVEKHMIRALQLLRHDLRTYRLPMVLAVLLLS